MSKVPPMTTSVVITGAASGIGAACAERFLDEGWEVIGWDKQPGSDERIAWYQVDVTDWDGLGRAAASLPPLGAVVNGAGIGSRASAMDLSKDEWDRVININLNGVFYVARWSFDALRRGQGVLFNMASITATSGFRERAPYSSTKAGILALTKVLAIEWAEYGVRVVAISPTFTRTPMLLEGIKAGRTSEEDIIRHTPQRRFLEPAEIASAIFRLAGPDFYAVTGSNILVDAGFDALSGF
jgi:NAD(P)-dependent dehydrogenase (short-subunit alcohol dehydrogenase family)